VSRGDLADDRERALALTPVSRETFARLERFVDLLLRWQQTTHLIAPSTVSHLWTRHVADSLQLLPLAGNARQWIDLGTGGGFPGMAIACALAEHAGAAVHLVESNKKKAAFLRQVAAITGAPALVHNERIAEFMARFNGHVEVVTARALAPLAELLDYSHPLLKKGVQGLFLKGQDVEAELTLAAKYWNIEATLVPSKTNPRAHIVSVRRAERRGPA
jgi:16S rRNA (guanine527-N7)-methyltransferase